MTRLTTYIHDFPVRNSGVSYQELARVLAKYEDTGLTPEAVQWLIDKHDEEVEKLESQLLEAKLALEEYESIGSRMLFRLLKNKYKNGELK